MPRNASGTYTLPAGNPVSPGTVIEAAWANDTLEDLANEITNSLSRTGAGGMLAPFRIADGLLTTPGLSFLNETNSGLYRASAGTLWMAVLGQQVAQFTSVGLLVPSGKTFTAQGNATIGGTFGVTGAASFSSTLGVTGAITATGGVVGNVTGNVTAGSGTSTFNNITVNGTLDMDAGSSATIINLPNPTNSGDAANKGYVDTQTALRLALVGGTMTGAIAMSSNKITGLGTPTADQDAATKAYVDSVAQGIDAKASCRAATTTNITLSGAQTIDGVTVIAGDRVLVKDQSSAAENGIYVAAAGAWARSSDANTWDELVAAFTFVEQGTANGNNGYICTISAGGTLGSTPVTWAQFSGAGQITAGAGLVKVGNTLNVQSASSARIVVGADEIDLATTGVTAGTYRSVTVDLFGRVTAGTNPTTLAGYGISDAYTTAQVDSLLNGKLSLSGGTMTGAIAMGTYKITGLGDPSNAQDAATKNYIDTVFGSTTSAAASAAAAASSASAASTSATNAGNSATSAAASASAAAASYDSFDDRYLGAKTSDPTVDNDGNLLITGALYFNSSVGEMRVYNGSAWVAAYLPAAGYLPISGGTLTGNLIVNTGADSRVLLQSSGTTQGQFQTTGALVRVASNNALPLVLSTNGVDRLTFDDVGNVTFGSASASGVYTFRGNNTSDIVVIESTDASATAAPDLVLYRNSASPAASDQLGVIIWRGKDSGAADQQYARIGAVITDPSAGSEDADLWFETTAAGAANERLRIASTGALGLNGANYGTSGQALISQGSGAPPTWGSAGISTGKAIAMAIVFGG